MAAIGPGFFDHGPELLEAGPVDTANEIRRRVCGVPYLWPRSGPRGLRISLDDTVVLLAG